MDDIHDSVWGVYGPSKRPLRREPLMPELDWNHLGIFLAVVREGSLSAAARVLGLSQPTVSRRIRALEEHFGGPLIERTPDGCRPSQRGLTLIPSAERMQAAADEITRLTREPDDEISGAVRIAAGGWIARLLMQRLPEMRAGAPGLHIEIVGQFHEVNLDRGDAEIALRTRRPRKGQLFARKMGTAPYACYGARDYVAAHPAAATDERYTRCNWCSFDEANAHLPSASWLRERLGSGKPIVRCNHSSLLLEAVRAGVGLALLPAFVGDADRELVRVGEHLHDLAPELWLVMHRDSRRLRRVAHVIERIDAIFGDVAGILP